MGYSTSFFDSEGKMSVHKLSGIHVSFDTDNTA